MLKICVITTEPLYLGIVLYCNVLIIISIAIHSDVVTICTLRNLLWSAVPQCKSFRFSSERTIIVDSKVYQFTQLYE